MNVRHELIIGVQPLNSVETGQVVLIALAVATLALVVLATATAFYAGGSIGRRVRRARAIRAARSMSASS